MRTRTVVYLFAFIASFVMQGVMADEDLRGIIESRPDGTVGTWVVAGHSVEATERTRLDTDDGPLQVGTCAEFDIDDGEVEEIDSEPAAECAR